MKESPRSRSLRIAAEFRAAAVAYVNSLPEFKSATDIVHGMQDKIKQIGLKDAQAFKQLRDLAEAGLLKTEVRGREHYYLGKGITLGRELQAGTHWKNAAGKAVEKITGAPVGKPLPAVVETQAQRMNEPQPLAHPEQKSEVTIDLVEKDGSLRIGIPGLQISIRKVKD